MQGGGSARCQAGHEGWELVGSCRLHALVLNLQPAAPTHNTGFRHCSYALSMGKLLTGLLHLQFCLTSSHLYLHPLPFPHHLSPLCPNVLPLTLLYACTFTSPLPHTSSHLYLHLYRPGVLGRGVPSDGSGQRIASCHADGLGEVEQKLPLVCGRRVGACAEHHGGRGLRGNRV